MPQILPLLPQTYGRYFEPFLGGGALFFALRPPRALLSDISIHIPPTYETLRDDLEGVERFLAMSRDDKECFERCHDMDISHLTPAEKAGRVIFLLKTCFNGVWREAKSGKLSMAYGYRGRVNILDRDNLRACSEALQGAEVKVCDFEAAVETAGAGDLVYFDPPYSPTPGKSGHTGYSRHGWTPRDDERLRECCLSLRRRGAHVVLSGPDTPALRRAYHAWEIVPVSVRHQVAGVARSRGMATELLIRG